MTVLKLAALAIVVLVAGAAAYVRLAPSDPARWHEMPGPPGEITDRDLAGGVMRRVEGDLAALDAIIRGTPRTQVLAGSLNEGMVTYVSRSRVFGFPDYTTVRVAGDTLEIHARLRFGESDMGVNTARVDGWLERLRQAR